MGKNVKKRVLIVVYRCAAGNKKKRSRDEENTAGS